MADYYVYSGAAGAGTGADWANAYTKLATAFSGKAAGSVFYVADDHAETQATAMSLACPGSVASPGKVLCVRRDGGSVPPVSADLRTTATVTTTGTSAITISGASGCVYWEGITFSAGSGAVSSSVQVSATGRFIFKNCSFQKAGTSISSGAPNLSAGNIDFINTSVKFGNASDRISVSGTFTWRDTATPVLGPTLPTILMNIATGGIVILEGVDLSSATTGQYTSISTRGMALFKDCKISSSVAISGIPLLPSMSFDFIRCSGDDVNYSQDRIASQGNSAAETTVFRSGGASDGTTPLSWRVDTNASAEWLYPFECFPITVWNETVGSNVTVTVEGRGAAVPNNDEVWMEVEYLGTAGSPLGNFATTNKADVLASAAAVSSSSESWSGGSESFKLVTTITPQKKGPITVYVKVAKVSSTFYIDPKIALS